MTGRLGFYLATLSGGGEGWSQGYEICQSAETFSFLETFSFKAHGSLLQSPHALYLLDFKVKMPGWGSFKPTPYLSVPAFLLRRKNPRPSGLALKPGIMVHEACPPLQSTWKLFPSRRPSWFFSYSYNFCGTPAPAQMVFIRTHCF